MVIEAPFLQHIFLKKETPFSGQYPFSTDIFKVGLDLSFDTPITIFAGENGSGKSTLLEIIALHCGFNLSGGNRNHVYKEQTADVAPALEHLKFSWNKKIASGFFMRAESFVQFASYIDKLAEDSPIIYRGYGGDSLHKKSHGEAFMELFSSDYSHQRILILDEPEAALSPQRQLALLAILKDMVDTGKCQVIMATHSPILMAIPTAKLLSIEYGEMVEKDYKSTAHFQIMKRFMDNPEGYIEKFLLNEI